MTTITNLKKILELLEAEGLGEERIAAGHDQIYLVSYDKIPENSEASKALDNLGAFYEDGFGWSIYV